MKPTTRPTRPAATSQYQVNLKQTSLSKVKRPSALDYRAILPVLRKLAAEADSLFYKKLPDDFIVVHAKHFGDADLHLGDFRKVKRWLARNKLLP